MIPRSEARATSLTTPAVSVIVPVWNVEPYIGRCIESLQEQTLENIEMIFVDDCGSDASMALVEAAVAHDPRIRILCNEQNMGPGRSRNAGIEAARGEYLSFVDPDDWVAPDFLELLYTKAHSDDLDIIKGTRATVDCGASADSATKSSMNKRMNQKLRGRRPLYTRFTYEHQAALFKRELVNTYGARYGEARKAQDLVFLLRVCYFAQSFAIEDRALYYFQRREGSATQTFSSSIMQAQLDSFADLLAFLEDHEADNSSATIYLSGLIQHNLYYQVTSSVHPGMEEQADENLKKLRDMLSNSKYGRLLSEKHLYAHALLAFGANLAKRPVPLIDKKMEAAGYLRVASNWTDYMRSHPDEKKRCEPEFVKAVLNALSFYQGINSHADARAYMSELNSRLGQQSLTHLLASWAVFPTHLHVSTSLPARAWRKLRRIIRGRQV